jgi:hypothetical protein
MHRGGDFGGVVAVLSGLCFLALQVFDDFYHKVPHFGRQPQTFGAINLFPDVTVFIGLVPVPATVWGPSAEFLAGVLGNGTAEADRHVKNSAGGAVQDAAIGALSGDDPVPFADRRFHDFDLVHVPPVF